MKNGFGDYLVTKKLLTKKQLQEAHKVLAKQPITLPKYLLTNNILTPDQVAQELASYAGIEYVAQITEDMADLDMLGKVPLAFLRDNEVMPIRYNGTLTLVTTNPLLFQPLDELNVLLGGGFTYAVAPQPVLIEAINRYYPLEGTKQMIEELGKEDEDLEKVDFQEIEEKDIVSMAEQAPIIKLVNHILYQAVKRGASDIHIEPFEKELVVRYRIDGVMYDAFNPPKRVQSALISRIKIMAHMNIAEKRIPQDGRIDIKVAGKPYDIRVSILPVAFGERVVMRILDKSRTFGVLKDLGCTERDYKVLNKAIHQPNGIIYVTGPTGSGKTTTLYSILSELNRPEVNIITVEDPIEYQMKGIGQVQVKEKIGLSFAAALRSILRQDPDIIMIGETRDQETAQIAIQASLTGHLVLSTLHTNSAPATITRLLDMGVEPFLIASSIELAIAQRLVRKLCDACKRKYHPSDKLLADIGISKKEAAKITFYEAVGCEKCNYTGYKGRLAIFEFMEMTSAIERLTMERADTSVIRRQAEKDGMTTLIQDGIRKIKEGLTTIEEVLSVAAIEQKVVE